LKQAKSLGAKFDKCTGKIWMEFESGIASRFLFHDAIYLYEHPES
jgi:hypothetical protein